TRIMMRNHFICTRQRYNIQSLKFLVKTVNSFCSFICITRIQIKVIGQLFYRIFKYSALIKSNRIFLTENAHGHTFAQPFAAELEFLGIYNIKQRSENNDTRQNNISAVFKIG